MCMLHALLHRNHVADRLSCLHLVFFFFQAEDGIRDWSVTGVQTCALPILVEHKKDVVIESSRITTSFLCSTSRLAFSITMSATCTWRSAGSSNVLDTTSPLDRKSVV